MYESHYTRNKIYFTAYWISKVYSICLWRPRKVSDFQKTLFSVHLPPNFLHPLDLGRPILNQLPPPPPPPPPSPSTTLANKLWNNNRTVHVNEQNQNKNKTTSRHIQIDHTFWFFNLANKQYNGIIINDEAWLHCLTLVSKGTFLVNNTLMFDSARCLVMA